MNMIEKLEDLEKHVWSLDQYTRQEASAELLEVLSEVSDDVFDGRFQWDSMCNGLVRWISGPNYKTCLVALKAISMIATRNGEDLGPTLNSMLPSIIDRLGDPKEQVRKEAASLIQVLMSYVKNPKSILEEMVPRVMGHKNAKVREGLLLCLSETLCNFGHKEIGLRKVMPSVLELLSDSSPVVREQAVETLCEIYKTVGEPVRNDILRRRSLPAQKEKMIIGRFDQLLNSGMVSRASGSSRGSLESLEEEKPTGGGGRVAKSPSSGTLNKRTMPLKKSASSTRKGGLTGGNENALLTDDNLDTYINDYSTVDIGSPKELADFCNNIIEILENSDDWEKRLAILKDLRGLMYCGVDHFKSFKSTVTGLSRALEKTVKDLRSQIVREVCITIAAMSTEMGNDFGTLAEKLLSPLFSQLLINVKVMNVSANVCCKRIVTCTHSSKMIPIICEAATKSKSAMCRRRCAEYIGIIFNIWELSLLTKSLSQLEAAVKSGINDADSEARVYSRQTFWVFHQHFPNNAENMMKTFDNSKLKMLRETKAGVSQPNSTTATLGRGNRLAPGSSATLPKPPTMSKSSPGSKAAAAAVTPSPSPAGRSSPFKRSSGQYSSMRNPRSTASAASPSGRTASQPRSSSSSGVRRSVSARSVNNVVSMAQPRSATLRKASKGNNGATATTPSASSKMRMPRTPVRKSASANTNDTSLATAFGRGTIPRMTSQDSVASSTDSSTHDLDLYDIARAIENTSWQVRKEAVDKLLVRINEDRGFNTRERKIVLQLFETLLNDNHAKILGGALNVLDEFLTLYKSNLNDWGATALAKGLYLQSMKQTQSNFERVMKILDTIHKSFGFDLQLLWCFNILESRQVQTNSKMKSTLIEFMACTIEAMEPEEFYQTRESSAGLKLLLASVTDPRAPDNRRKSQLLIAQMFRHNPAVFSSIVNTLTEGEQAQCMALLQETVPNMLPQELEVLHGYPGYSRLVDQHSATSEESASLFDAINQRFGSSPGSCASYDVDAENINPATAAITSKINDLNLNDSNCNELSEQRDTSLRSEHQQIHQMAGAVSSPRVETPSRSRAAAAIEPDSTTGPDTNGSAPDESVVFAVLEALLGGTAEEKGAALMSALNILREDRLVNEDNSYDLLSAILACIEDGDVELVNKAIKVMNKFLVYQPKYTLAHSEEIIAKVTKAKVALAIGDNTIFQVLVSTFGEETIIKIVMPMLQNETFPVLLAVINLLYQCLKDSKESSKSVLEPWLAEMGDAVCPHCSHVETNVRKQSIFCLVELLLLFGPDQIDPHLKSLTVSQKKLVYLYYNRHQRTAR